MFYNKYMPIFANKYFENPIDVISAYNDREFKKAVNKIEKFANTYYCLGYIRYSARDVFLDKSISSAQPLLYFEIFDKYNDYQPSDVTFLDINALPSLSYQEYSDALSLIKSEIAQGNTYEVNYTYDWLVNCSSQSKYLYDYLLKKQKTPYNTFIKNEHEEILSFSPELFFEYENGHIITKPMKGTVPRGKTADEDFKNIEFLKNDIKNRAENVMIVDLLRNDLSKISQTGTVKVSKLFDIETHATLHQMTSTIEADLQETVTLYDILKAIFPCGSITGAPKISTMDIIDKVEKGARDVYCGAIGFLSPQKYTFSVPIRILQKTKDEQTYRYRVGGAIVWDSDINDEWMETHTKAAFLNDCDFQIIETIKVQNGKMLYAKEHFERMKSSAKRFNFKMPKELENFKPEKDGLLRILLSKNGFINIEYRQLLPDSSDKITISDIKVKSNEEFLFHKTTYRPWFEKACEKIKNGQIYDQIFFNEKGEITEGSRTNILIEKNKKLYTPKIKSGLLNGILRQKLINQGKCQEKILYLSDLKDADRIFCINSVRGIKEVRLDTD